MTVAVVGAGFAGLMVAAELHRKGIDTVVLEAGPAVGGVAASVQCEGFTLEPGVGSFLRPDPAFDHYISEFDLDVVQSEGSRERYVGRSHALVEMPTGPAALASWKLLSAAGKVRALAEVAVTSVSDGESVSSFFARRFGSEAGTLAAHLAAAGVFAGDPHALSMAATFPRAIEMERTSGSLVKAMIDQRRATESSPEKRTMYVPGVSMTAIARQLARPLQGRVHTDFAVASVVRRGTGWGILGREDLDVEQVVIATSPSSASAFAPVILGPMLSGRPHAPVAVVGLGSQKPMHLPEGFGALAHPDDHLVSLGVLFESSYAPHRAPDGGGLIKVIAGGTLRPEAVKWPDEYLGRVVGGEVSSMLQQPVEADWVKVVRRSIPQYNLGHQQWLERVDDALTTLPGLHLTGWGYRGVGLGHVAADALRVAAAVECG